MAGAGRRAARRTGGGGRVRGVHVDRVGADGVASPARSRSTCGAAGRAGVGARRRRFRLAALGGVVRRSRSRWWRAGSTSRCSSAGRSRSRRARSARCCCSASGGSGLTARGAAAGLLAGAAVATGAIFTGLALEGGHPTVDALLTQPAVLSVPVAFAVMVARLAARPRRPPARPTPSCSRCTRPRAWASGSSGRRGTGAWRASRRRLRLRFVAEAALARGRRPAAARARARAGRCPLAVARSARRRCAPLHRELGHGSASPVRHAGGSPPASGRGRAAPSAMQPEATARPAAAAEREDHAARRRSCRARP